MREIVLAGPAMGFREIVLVKQYAPHTIRNKESRDCEDCHVSKGNDNNAWLAGVLVRLIDLDARGVYHATSRGNISWFEFAREIVRMTGLDVAVEPQTTAELGRPAPRPAYSTLDVGKLEALIGSCPSWRDGLREHLRLRARRS